ncbi:TonB-dependent receptor family protein [Ramlibacter pallidus]|uniref:TonB-dependent receptor n=1 Tax=Ramlibacter pallidus TaxID=2780087 RepID=A0ABR9RZZ9_9BURK|nr:TonB-dependent receptor [Ramlibacter pallidus]MBE7366377.1 TonB-dependent receptor [Ramlibacter pallidus]
MHTVLPQLPWRFALLPLALLAALPAAAQATDGDPTLRPVVVTPLPGVPQASFDTPASVDVVDGATLRNGQLGINLSESLARVPGVLALHRQNYAQDLQISVRGFGARATFGVRGLRLYADGIPATAPDGQGQVSHFDLGTADRIEVLRGPFSALYGNSSGGVISVFTADGLPGVQLEAGVAAGSFGTRRQNVRVAGDSGDWNYHLHAVRFDTDGSREHGAARRTGFNGKLRWRPGADTRITLVANAVDMPGTQDPLGLTRAEYEADPRRATPVALQYDTRKSMEQAQLGAMLEHRFSDANAAKVTVWRGRRATEQFQAIPPGPQGAATHAGGVIALDRTFGGVDAQWTHRTRWLRMPFVLTAGLAADRLDEHRRGYQNFIGPRLGVAGSLRRDEENRVSSFDQYLQAQWSLERFTLTGGVRHASVRFRSEDRYVTGGNPDDSGGARFSASTPVVGAVFHATDDLNLYASLGRGFETPTFNELSYRPGNQPGLNFDLRPAASRHWEIGVKAQPLPDWRANAALFQARTEDEIVVASNTGGRSTFRNAGETRRRGIEASLAGRWGTGWSLLVAATWLDATYASGFGAVPAGRRIPGIPRTSAFAELAWKHRPTGFEAAVEFRHVGRIAVNDANTDFAPAANLWNLRLGLQQKLDRWTLREFIRVDNVLDRAYAGSVIVNEGNGRFFEPAPGRHWIAGASATYAF